MAPSSTATYESFPTLGTGLKRYLASGELSDMTIKCGDTVHNVHRLIVCSQSSFFANDLKPGRNFKARQARFAPAEHPRITNAVLQDAQASTLELHEDDPDAVHAAINFMYGQSYPETRFGDSTMKRVLFHVSVYAIADKYGIGGLREYCAKHIDALLDVDERDFKPKVLLCTVSAIHDNTPGNDDVLRPALVRIAAKHSPMVFREPDFHTTAELAAWFGPALLRELASS